MLFRAVLQGAVCLDLTFFHVFILCFFLHERDWRELKCQVSGQLSALAVAINDPLGELD